MIFLFALFFSFTLHAQQGDLPKLEVRELNDGARVLVLQRGGVEQKVGTIKKLIPGEVFFHWAPYDLYRRYVSVGVTAADFNKMRAENGGAAGGGFYVSRSPVNSRGYGTNCVEVVIQKELDYLDSGYDNMGMDVNFTPEEIAKLFPDTPKIDSLTAFTRMLEDLKISAWQYSNSQDGSWLNLIRWTTLRKVIPANIDDQITALKNLTSNLTIESLITFDLQVGLKKSEALKKLFPEVHSYYFENDLSEQIRSVIKKLFIDESLANKENPRIYLTMEYQQATFDKAFPDSKSLLNRLKKDFAVEIKELILKKIEENKSEEPLLATLKFNGIFLGMKPEELGLDSRVGYRFSEVLPILAMNNRAVMELDENGIEKMKVYQEAVDFMDRESLILEMAKGNPNPFSIYDEPGLPPYSKRLQNASEAADRLIFNYGNDDSKPAPPESYLKILEKRGPKKKVTALVKVNRELTGNPEANFRGSPLLAEGNVSLNGIKYYRLDAWQKARLEKNPYLVSEIVADPETAGAYLARHEYPSARTYEKFKDKLSKRLQSQLDQAFAEGKLAKTDSHEFSRLTKAIITELILSPAMSDYELEYMWHVNVIAPFEKYNSETLNFLTNRRLMNVNPMNSWRELTFLKPEELRFYGHNNASKFQNFIADGINEAIAANKANPDFFAYSPLVDIYYDHPAFSRPYSEWRIEALKKFSSEEFQKKLQDSKFKISKEPFSCSNLLKP